MRDTHTFTPLLMGGRSLHPAQRIGSAMHTGLPVIGAAGAGSSLGSLLVGPAPDLTRPPVLRAGLHTVLASRDGANMM